jgi:hypothetical protein
MQTNIVIAKAAGRDSSRTQSLAFLGMIFLHGTFLAVSCYAISTSRAFKCFDCLIY